MNILLFVFTILPLLAFFAVLFFRNKEEKGISFLVQGVTGAYVLLSIAMAANWGINGFVPAEALLATLYKTSGFEFSIRYYYDGVTAVFSVTGAIVFFLVASFSKFYMHRDEGFKRFFATLLLFLTGYNLIIFSGNFETMFIGWETIGLSSFLLIAFYRHRYLPVKNAFKVISIYRISDVALILAMWMMHHLMHQNITFTQLGEARDVYTTGGQTSMAIFIALMILLAAMTKSAQLPFTSWLPRAMEGPTSSSAIFYGSLSVHIGIFLLLRTYPFWEGIAGIKFAVIIIGALTGIIATLIARTQPTVKTQIAYSSAAQIGIMFIEVALGWHVLALIHFSGNAFLRTYQLLVSPSVLNYLVHHQYFHYKAGNGMGKNKWVNTLYTLGIREWNFDGMMRRYLWTPFKWLGKKLIFLETRPARILTVVPAAISVYALGNESIETPGLPVLSISIALSLILYAFTSRRSAKTAWVYLLFAHFFILAGIMGNMDTVDTTQVIMYGSGIAVAGFLGFVCLQRMQKLYGDICLSNYHGYAFGQKTTALLFLLSAVGMLGFPITAAFIGIDVFFTHIGANQVALLSLTALSFLFIELAAIRIYCRIFLGLPKQADLPLALRST